MTNRYYLLTEDLQNLFVTFRFECKLSYEFNLHSSSLFFFYSKIQLIFIGTGHLSWRSEKPDKEWHLKWMLCGSTTLYFASQYTFWSCFGWICFDRLNEWAAMHGTHITQPLLLIKFYEPFRFVSFIICWCQSVLSLLQSIFCEQNASIL